MIILTAIALAGYIGGGVTLGVRKNGAAPALSAHPHHERWAEFAGLCRDGVRFTQQKLRGADGGGSGGSSRAPLISAERGSPSKSKAGKAKGSGKAEKKRHKKGAKHQHTSSHSRSSGGGSGNNSGGDRDLTAAASGDASGLSQQQLQEQRFVAENLHESQAKIAVVGLNEM